MFYHIRPNHKPQHSTVVSFKRLIMWSDIQIISYTISVSYQTYTENAVIYQLSHTVFAVAQGLSLAVNNVQNKGVFSVIAYCAAFKELNIWTLYLEGGHYELFTFKGQHFKNLFCLFWVNQSPFFFFTNIINEAANFQWTFPWCLLYKFIGLFCSFLSSCVSLIAFLENISYCQFKKIQEWLTFSEKLNWAKKGTVLGE